jgi:nucleotide sugar dehydrogenase
MDSRRKNPIEVIIMPDVCVVGLGEIGLPTAKFLKGMNLSTYGFDIRVEAADRAHSAGITASTDWNDLPKCDIYIICVSTGFDEVGNPDFSSVFSVADNLREIVDRDTVISLESTLNPGISRRIFREVFESAVRLVHVPHRYWLGGAERHGVSQQRVIGGVDEESLRKGLMFYRDLLGIPVTPVSSIEVAEMSKIAENAYRFVQIAFVEELKLACIENGLSFEEVRVACNTKWNIQMLEARDGIGGSCLPKDLRYLSSLSMHNEILKAAMSSDEEYTKQFGRK